MPPRTLSLPRLALSPLRKLAIIAAVGVSLLAMPGCDTLEGIRDTKAVLQQLEAERKDLALEASKIDATAAGTEKAEAAAALREETIRQSIAQVSQQLASASGPTFDALSDTLKNLQANLAAARDQHAAAADQAAMAASLQAQVASEIAAVDDALSQGHARLESLQQALNAKADGVGGLIRQVGDAVQGFGVPGAAPISDTAANLWGGLAGLVLGGGGAYVASRKKIAAGQEIAESIQMARNTSPQFAAALEEIKSTLGDYQGDTAKAIVKAAQASIPTKPAANPDITTQ